MAQSDGRDTGAPKRRSRGEGVATFQLTGLSTSLAAEGRPSPGLQLRVESGDQLGQTFAVGHGALSLGKGSDADIRLDDSAVSRQHVRLLPVRNGIHIRDLGSTNGTFVDEARVFEAVVHVGRDFRVGNTRLRVIDGGALRIAPSSRQWFGGLIGDSVVMREVFAVLERAAPSDATVLIEGSSGTGKELAARSIHDHSARARGPYVAFDCGTVSHNLLQSALMGHVKGAFTGADRQRPGAFVEADNGTLFLDEIGEMPLEAQSHLLRVLETSQVKPVGGDRTRDVDVRVVAATNRDLFAMVEAGTFRLDLYHRLAVVHVGMPALSQHLDDLPVLIRAFYEERGVEPGPIDGPTLQQLERHPFDGNVRELRNILERSLVLADPDRRSFHDLVLQLGPGAPAFASRPPSADVSLSFKAAKERAVDAFEADYLPRLVDRFDGNLTQAAKHAGLSRQHLRSLLQKHGLREPSP